MSSSHLNQNNEKYQFFIQQQSDSQLVMDQIFFFITNRYASPAGVEFRFKRIIHLVLVSMSSVLFHFSV